MTPRKRGSGKTLVDDARAAIETCAGMNARMAARRITRFLEARLLPTGLSLAQFGLMAHIAAATEGTVGALALAMDLDQSTLSRNLQALDRLGLVEIAVVEKDLRRRAVWLTEAGARRLEAAMPAWRDAQAALAEVVDPVAARRLAVAAAALADPARRSGPTATPGA